MDLREFIDRTIKLTWLQDIKGDYDYDFLLKEDSLKNSFYHHLRNRLGDGFLKRYRLRIFTEYYLEDKERADLAIVQLKPKQVMDRECYHLKDRVDEVLAVIEFKHKNSQCGVEPFFADVEKAKKYIRHENYRQCQVYLGFIHETEYSAEESSWLSKNEQVSWAKGRLTELTAFHEKESDKFEMKILSYNKMNSELNSKI